MESGLADTRWQPERRCNEPVPGRELHPDEAQRLLRRTISPTKRSNYFRVLRNLDIASRRSCSSCFHFQRGACSDSAESSTMGFNSGGALRHSQMCIRMCVASLNTFDSPDIARRAASAARTRRAWSFGSGASTPISRKAESISSGRISLATGFTSPASLRRKRPSNPCSSASAEIAGNCQ